MVIKGRHASRRHQAQRTGAYAESKCTNWRNFNPFHLEVRRVIYDKYFDEIQNAATFSIRTAPVAAGFIMPITENDVREFLECVPKHFLTELKGIILLGGSQKQQKARDSALFCYGCYCPGLIFIMPFPADCLTEKFKRLSPPHIRQAYERAGATYEQVPGGWIRRFTLDALRRFYLYDVLAHEIGHHVDRMQRNGRIDRNQRKSESFAEWFVREFGYKLTHNSGAQRL